MRVQIEDAAQAVFRITGKCLLANQSVEGFANSDSEKGRSEKAKYKYHLIEAIASALAIKSTFETDEHLQATAQCKVDM